MPGDAEIERLTHARARRRWRREGDETLAFFLGHGSDTLDGLLQQSSRMSHRSTADPPGGIGRESIDVRAGHLSSTLRGSSTGLIAPSYAHRPVPGAEGTGHTVSV
jgi:hypothetical protein